MSAGKFLLPEVQSSFTVLQGWGYFEVDYIDLSPTSVTPPKPPPGTLSDVNATMEAQQLMSYLTHSFGSVYVVLVGT